MMHDCPSSNSTSSSNTTATTCAGHGLCVGSSGFCNCFAGYTGDACDSCDKGYLLVGNACVFMPGALVSCTDGVRCVASGRHWRHTTSLGGGADSLTRVSHRKVNQGRRRRLALERESTVIERGFRAVVGAVC